MSLSSQVMNHTVIAPQEMEESFDHHDQNIHDIQLITEVERNEMLYKKNHPLFKDKYEKHQAWKTIGIKLGMGGK